MKDSLIFEHKKYISAKRASELVGYTRDYVGQLSREGKIDRRMVGRSWFISEESILNHKAVNTLNNKKNAELLSLNKKHSQTTQINTTPVNTPSTLNTNLNSNTNTSITDTNTNTAKENTVPKNVLPIISNPILPIVKSNPSPLIDKNIFLGISGNISNNIVNPVKSAINNSQMISGMPQLSVAGSSMKFSQSISSKSVVVNPVSKFYTKENIAMAFMSLVIVFNIFFIKDNFINNSNKNVAGVSEALSIESIKHFASTLARGFGIISERIALRLNLGEKSYSVINSKPVVAKNDNPNSVGYAGIAVLPSTNSPEKDEIIKQHIKDTFSDEVNVRPDPSGSAGVITPVFKKATKDSYIYVLVPTVENKR